MQQPDEAPQNKTAPTNRMLGIVDRIAVAAMLSVAAAVPLMLEAAFVSQTHAALARGAAQAGSFKPGHATATLPAAGRRD